MALRLGLEYCISSQECLVQQAAEETGRTPKTWGGS